jgi:hypothetical protein
MAHAMFELQLELHARAVGYRSIERVCIRREGRFRLLSLQADEALTTDCIEQVVGSPNKAPNASAGKVHRDVEIDSPAFLHQLIT